jgi:predicted GNAT superfamily acetyltransferase
MAPAVRRKKRKDEIKVVVGLFRNLADYKTCEDIQREVLHAQDIDVVPISMLLAASRAGGILLGAYSSLGDMVGFVFSMLGSLNGELTQYSYMLAVRAAYRNFDVGFKLKMAQRKEALKRKISRIACAFDPLQPLNAYFVLGKLGAWANTYEENFYGETVRQMDRGLPVDRILAQWDLEGPNVMRRLELGPPRRDFRKELKSKQAINQLVETAPGLLSSTPVQLNCSEAQLIFEVPYNLQEIKHRDLGIAMEWQGRMRQVFQHYFKKDYVANDFWVSEQEGHLRACFILEKRKP